MHISIGIYTTCLSLLNTYHYVAHFLWDFFFLFSTYYLFFRYVLLIACLLLILAYYHNTTLLTQHFVVTIS